MPSLRELQEAFAAALVAPADTRLEAFVVAGALAPAARIEVYRNNLRHNYREALRAVYAVTERLVGAAFFEHAADAYLPGHRSPQGNLHAYGRHFAGFLARFGPAAGLPYLPDVARLEWSLHTSFHAADRPPLDARRLAVAAAAPPGAIALRLHPACRLLRSRFPIDRIWAANQDHADGVVRLDEGGVCLLVSRPHHAVGIERVGAGEFALLKACAAGRRLDAALAAAVAAQPAFDLAGVLARRVADATVAGVALRAS